MDHNLLMHLDVSTKHYLMSEKMSSGPFVEYIIL